MRLHRKFWLQSLLTENESMNVDKDEDPDEGEGEGGETVPGCILNIGIEGIWPELLVRKEYIQLYNYCKKYLRSHCDDPMPPSVVITGQPGIGKSIWITYAVCQRLTEGEPFIWFSGTRRYLFVAEGVFVVPPDHPPTDFKIHIWTFIDADDSKDGIPDHVATHRTRHLIILTSSPKSSRWKLLTKTTQCSTAIMDPWTREEISQAAVTYGLTASDLRIDEMYYQYGPTPRICFDFLCNESLLFAHEALYESTLGKLSLQKFGYMASDNVNSGMADESHTLVLVTRLPVDGDGDGKFSLSRLEPITLEGTKRIAGVLYESLVQDMLEEKIALKLVPMVKRELSESGRRLKFPRWLSDHGDRRESVAYMVYYALEAQNQVAFDSFIMAEGKLYIFQFTIGSDHSMKEGIVRFFSKKVPGVPPRADWHFVFVAPSRASVSEVCCSPQPQDDDFKELLNEMNLFSAVLNCEA
ncbi:hypothetical protein EDB83DRAFT_2675610 [Lactarius deliciosus]|nr:hypothetical protein EDB83DRAFT_2675610 [Lactarius deliciosus]